MRNGYASKLRALLSPAEARLLGQLRTPDKIQSFLDHFPEKLRVGGETAVHSPHIVLKKGRAHCIEGAIVAAAALAYHGSEPLLMDIQSTDDDYDHVVALFKQNGLWGAISKTNHPVLRWRDPVYRSVRELAMSYFNEYFLPDAGVRLGSKTMRAYSRPFNLKKYPPSAWWAAASLDWLAEELDQSPHYPALPPRQAQFLRRASRIELQSYRLREWPKRKKLK